MKITSAEFIKSTFQPQDYPPDSLPEVAFAGKSNVGKSSLINTLVNRKKLAHTSSTPGRTQSINFFRINQKITFVDLPGYGFAKVPLAIKRQWKPMVETYLQSRKNLYLVVVILDCRRESSSDDISLLEWLKFHNIPLAVVLTKIDKVSHNQKTKQKALIKKSFSLEESQIVLFSAVSGEGKEDLWKKILSHVSTR
ncbi:MAG: ribosome biogenesis GTP-binding protein YihA/YsxC [Pseudomonadota bacterium]